MLIVDLDDDVGRVLGESVIVGYERVMQAAVRFALENPEDADVNAMFAGLSLFNRLSKSYDYVEVAVVGGDAYSSVEAQRRVKERVEAIAEKLGKEGLEIYLVSDGEDELLVGQILASIAPIAAVKRVIVSQHLGIESNYMLILRYLKKVGEEPRLSVYFLAVPGFLLTVFSLLSLIGLLSLALKIALLIVGLALLIYGLRLEDTVRNITLTIVEELRDRPHIKIGGMAVVAIMSLSGLVIAYYSYTSEGLVGLVESLLAYTIPLTLGGLAVYAVIKIIVEAARGSVDISRQLALVSVLGFSAIAFYSLGTELTLLREAGSTLPEAIIRGLIESKFLQYVIVGAGAAGLIELVSRAFK
ncbi:MAG: DUF373 family protein [Desulfurococcales archaeon]|nr:DUF373 family protein [Desulfurococcales archaeon]